MGCAICGKTKEQAELFNVIHENQIVKMCQACAKMEGVTLIRKPTEDQLSRADKRATVRERMMHMSGLDLHVLSKDHEIAQRNLAKIRIPGKIQEPDDLVKNYNWVIKLARRRKKLPLSEISKTAGVSEEIIKDIENGKLPKNYEKIIRILENMLDIRILKEHETSVKFIMPEKNKSPAEKQAQEEHQKQVVKQVQEQERKQQQEKQKQEAVKKLQKGEFDFSDKKILNTITLNDLLKAKREKEKQEKSKRNSQEKTIFFGDDIQLDEEIE